MKEIKSTAVLVLRRNGESYLRKVDVLAYLRDCLEMAVEKSHFEDAKIIRLILDDIRVVGK